MGRLQQVTRGFVVAVWASLGGCVHLQPDAKPETKKTPDATETRTEPGVQQASAKVPAAVPSASLAALAKFGGFSGTPKDAATDIVLAWQNKVAQLPDPTRNGAMVHGVVGQLFLFTAESSFAQANGKLTVEMTDEADGKRLGTWTFEKDVLKRMATSDERFGKCYAIFLVWPEYDPKVSRVKFSSRYDPEKGYALFAPATTLTFDNGSHGPPIHQKRQVSGVDVAGFGGLNALPSAPRPLPNLDPLPVGGRNAQNLPAPTITPLPSNLPPLVITTQR